MGGKRNVRRGINRPSTWGFLWLQKLKHCLTWDFLSALFICGPPFSREPRLLFPPRQSRPTRMRRTCRRQSSRAPTQAAGKCPRKIVDFSEIETWQHCKNYSVSQSSLHKSKVSLFSAVCGWIPKPFDLLIVLTVRFDLVYEVAWLPTDWP